jgi:hypothetical protein
MNVKPRSVVLALLGLLSPVLAIASTGVESVPEEWPAMIMDAGGMTVLVYFIYAQGREHAAALGANTKAMNTAQVEQSARSDALQATLQSIHDVNVQLLLEAGRSSRSDRPG